MLGFLCARPKPRILNPLIHFYGFSAAHQGRLLQTPIKFSDSNRHRHHSSACRLFGPGGGGGGGGVASIWHVIQSSGFQRRGCQLRRPRGEGSWNVAWDARPARWLYRPDSAWLLFGVCACLAPVDFRFDGNSETFDNTVDETDDGDSNGSTTSDAKSHSSADYKVTGVLADGRCLFRAIAHGACLRSGEEAPDEDRQRELADELRSQVVNELLKRREEIKWFIEGDFEDYVKRIQEPYVWGGEPELLMASHILRTTISVFMIDRRSSNLVNISNYGEEYRTDPRDPINVLFHGYGHYDLLETLPGQSYQKVSA
uniref:Ubiquitin thioesterase OTU n=2 Tax=Rhizophora mucronata TaxID=61149 RepID=A0A2P2LDS8_RHIMU